MYFFLFTGGNENSGADGEDLRNVREGRIQVNKGK